MSIRRINKLTPKQTKAIAIIGPEDTVWAGVKKCVAVGLVTPETFYKRWVKDEAFLNALNTERERLLGALADRLKARAMAESDRLFQQMIEIAAGEKRANTPQIEAIKYVLDRAGIDTTGGEKRGNLFVMIQQRIMQQVASPAMAVVEEKKASDE
jgi:hypothetical protein